MKNKNKTIGILGGMGPSASADLYSKIIKYCQHKYNAVQDYEYPQIIILSLAMYGFEETGIVNENLVKNQLIEGAKKLELAGADFVIIACNTVHCFYNQIQVSVKIPVLSIIEETKKKVLWHDIKKVGILSSESTNKLKLYQKSFENNNIKLICANKKQQKTINSVIENVMAGKHGHKDKETLKLIINNYLKHGAQAVVLGCTEIPLAINQKDASIKLFDTLQIIAESAVDLAFKK